MAEVYKHVPKTNLEDIVQCGLKLTQWGLITCKIAGFETRFIPAYLNPKDDDSFYGREDYTCLRIQIPNDYCKIGNYFLYNDQNELLNDLFVQSIIPVQKYIFGNYRKPICLISRTVQGEEISITDKVRDYPILVDNSVELYLNNLIADKSEEDMSWLDAVLYAYYSDLADKGIIVKVECEALGISVFINKDKKMVTLKIPAMEELRF